MRKKDNDLTFQEIAEKARTLIAGDTGKVLEVSTLDIAPRMMMLKGHELIVVFLANESFDEATREVLKMKSEHYYEGHVVRFWANSFGHVIKDATNEDDFRLDTLTPEVRRTMSKAEWASFGCQVVAQKIEDLGEEVIRLQSDLSGPPHILSRKGNQIVFRFVLSYPDSGDRYPTFFPNDELLGLIYDDIKELVQTSLEVGLAYIPFADGKDDPFDPRFAERMNPIRGNPLILSRRLNLFSPIGSFDHQGSLTKNRLN